MTLLSDIFASFIITYSLWSLLLSLVFYLFRELSISSGRKLSFSNFPRNLKFYNVSSVSGIAFAMYIFIGLQALFLILSIIGGAYLYSFLYLTNMGVGTLLWLSSLAAGNDNRDLSRYQRHYEEILSLEESLPKQEELLQQMETQLKDFKSLIAERQKEFNKFIEGDFLSKSHLHYDQLRAAYQAEKSNNLASKVDSLKHDFEIVVKAFVASSNVVPMTKVDASIVNGKAFYDLANKNMEVLTEDTKGIANLLFQDFSSYDEKEIIEIIRLATKYRFSVTTLEIDRILERVKSLPSKSDLLNLLYSSNAITAPIIIQYLEQDQDWIITPQMYDILKSGELSNVLSLLVEKNLLQSTRKFLQKLPALKLQILYRITREIKNPTSELILEFRSFLPLRFMFSDPSTMYFNMYNALKNVGKADGLGSQEDKTLQTSMIQDKDLILRTYQNEYDKSSELRSQFESVKLDFLSSNLKNSSMIRLEAAMELFYQYAVNLKQQEAQVLFEMLEALYFIEETDRLKLEEFQANQGLPVTAQSSLVKYNESGKSKLKRLMNKNQSLIKQIMSRIEQQRQSYDRLLEMVK